MSDYEIDQRDKPFSSMPIGGWLAFNTEGDACQKISRDQIGFYVGNRFEVETIERINDGVYPVYFYEPITEPITEHDEEQTIETTIQCEIDSSDWLECDANSKELIMMLVSGEECVGGITIGRGQIQKLIDYLERAKEVVQ